MLYVVLVAILFFALFFVCCSCMLCVAYWSGSEYVELIFEIVNDYSKGKWKDLGSVGGRMREKGGKGKDAFFFSAVILVEKKNNYMHLPSDFLGTNCGQAQKRLH